MKDKIERDSPFSLPKSGHPFKIKEKALLCLFGAWKIAPDSIAQNYTLQYDGIGDTTNNTLENLRHGNRE